MSDLLWINLQTAPRERVEESFIAQRDEILMRIIRFQGELESYNENRFPDNPIVIPMDFTEQLDKYLGLEKSEKRRIYNKVFDELIEIKKAH